MNIYSDVALVLWNRDVIELVSMILLTRNLKARGIEPSDDVAQVEEFILTCAPTVVVLDLEPPYHQSVSKAQYLLNRFPDRPFVLTCADPALATTAAPWLSVHPLYQKPFEIDALVEKIHSMVKRSCLNAATVGS
jgi:AmiR/NasT family two-component response regulator